MIVMKKYAITQLKKSKILMLRYGEKFTISDELMEVVANYMNDDLREKLHNELTPCSNETFLKEYCEVVYLPRTEGISTTKIKDDLKDKL